MALIDHEHPVDVSPPWEPDTTFGLRLLAWPEREEAQLQKTRQSFAVMEGVNPEVMAAIPSRDDRPMDTSSDPLDEYDLLTLLRYGVVKWSYDRDLDEQSLRLLDDRTAKWLGRAIVDLNTWNDDDAGKSSGHSTPSTLGQEGGRTS